MSWSARRVALAALAIAVLAAVLVAVGRWEKGREVRREVNGFHVVQRLIGPLDSPTLSGYRVLPGFDCLTYRRGANPFALELCVDRGGRVVEAIDRRTFDRRIWSLQFEPAASTDRVDRAEVDRLLRKMGAT
ncbi:MAG TPA: hypothetical protein VFA19_05310 [Gaiellaceae bacterium]|nr:hypothetical protein [Gaiellaceae bacterium]